MVRGSPTIELMSCGLLLQPRCRHAHQLAGPHRPSGRRPSRGDTPISIMSPGGERHPCTEISLGAHAHPQVALVTVGEAPMV